MIWEDQRGVVHQISHGASSVYSPIPSQDGRSILFASSPHPDPPSSVGAMDTLGNVRGVIPKTKNCFPGGWSGTSEVVLGCQTSPSGGRFGTWHVLVMALDGSSRRVIAPQDPGNAPSVSPDGKSVAYGDDDKLYVVGINGGTPHLVSPGTDGAAWTPDGGHLVFATTNATGVSLVMVDLQGGDRHTIVSLPWSGGISMTFSPDGRQILIGGSADTSNNFWEVGVDGTHLRQLTSLTSGMGVGDPVRFP